MEGTVVGVTLVSGMYGGYDNLADLPEGHGFDRAVCVTDSPTLSAAGWDIDVLDNGEDFRLAGKRPKLTPFRFVQDDVAVWVDASVQIMRTDFVEYCLASLGGHDLVVSKHPESRVCLFDEAAYCQDWPQNRHMPLREQTAFYRSDGMPERYGLWACAILVWRNTQESRQFGDAWLAENQRWSTRDQVSFPYL
ncbi:MAG TPA: glycosyltransferase domain-containing protein, partial [Acidimicrobiia bacterium]